MEKLKALILLLQGYKTYIVGVGAVIFGVLVAAGVVTNEQVQNFAEVAGGAIIAFGAALMTLRAALAKLIEMLGK